MAWLTMSLGRCFSSVICRIAVRKSFFMASPVPVPLELDASRPAFWHADDKKWATSPLLIDYHNIENARTGRPVRVANLHRILSLFKASSERNSMTNDASSPQEPMRLPSTAHRAALVMLLGKSTS